MSDSIEAKVVADSIGPHNERLTTFVIEYPRFILAEINTHRALSRNTSSSRAIPVKKMMYNIRESPACPVFWGANQSGMQSKAELDAGDATSAQAVWVDAMQEMLERAEQLRDIGLHKQIANRILEPWMTTKTIVSSTNWENFFALRAHEDAQPEFQNLAYKMLEAINEYEPDHIQLGAWHIPFGDKFDTERVEDTSLFDSLVRSGASTVDARVNVMLKIAVARCARVSYLNFEGKDDYESDIRICDKLFGSFPRHLSPAEHVAQCVDRSLYSTGNFQGFKQFRKFFRDENAQDTRVKKIEFDHKKIDLRKDSHANTKLIL